MIRHASSIASLAGVAALSLGLIGSTVDATAREQTRMALVPVLDALTLAAFGDVGSGEAALPVSIVQEGGPLDVAVALRQAVADQVALTDDPQSSHLLRAEVVGERPHVVVSLRLWRRGWDLFSPSRAWVYTAPWAVIGSALVGALAVWSRVRVWGGILLSAGLLQLIAWLLPWPSGGLGSPSLGEWVMAGPLAQVALADVDGVFWAYGASLAGVSSIGFLLQGRARVARSVRLGPASVAAVAASLGAVAWLEAAGRLGGLAMHASWTGLLSLGLVVAVWLMAVRRAATREEPRA